MNKFETNLLQVLSSIDESLKIIATGKAPAKAPAKKAKAPKIARAAPAKANGKAAKRLAKSKDLPVQAKADSTATQ